MLRLFNAVGTFVALGAAFVFAAMPASAQIVDGASVDEVVAVMEEFGITVDVERPNDAEGPVLVASLDALHFIVAFEACDSDGEGCELLVFRRGFAMDPSDQPDMDTLNAWNFRNWGKVAMDEEGDPWIILEVNNVGGLTEANLTDTLEWWVSMVEEFADSVGFVL